MSRHLGLPVIGKTPLLENIEAFILKHIAAAQREHHISSERADCLRCGNCTNLWRVSSGVRSNGSAWRPANLERANLDVAGEYNSQKTSQRILDLNRLKRSTRYKRNSMAMQSSTRSLISKGTEVPQVTK